MINSDLLRISFSYSPSLALILSNFGLRPMVYGKCWWLWAHNQFAIISITDDDLSLLKWCSSTQIRQSGNVDCMTTMTSWLSVCHLLQFFALGGFPNASLFPFASMVVKTNDGRSIDIAGPTMEKALQYLPTAGLPELVTWLKKLQVSCCVSWSSLFSKFAF